MPWHNIEEVISRAWTCGYCGVKVGGDMGYAKTMLGHGEVPSDDHIYLCPHCDNPTVFISEYGETVQIPGPLFGTNIENLPESIEALYDEIRNCIRDGSYTAAVLAERKLLMHLAVDNGAQPDLRFIQYIEYLSDEGYVPPNGKEWVDEIRKRSNEANHEIVMASQEDAVQLLDFTEMLLKFVYEFPMKIRRK